jgi:hypothetical protein
MGEMGERFAAKIANEQKHAKKMRFAARKSRWLGLNKRKENTEE